MKKGKRWPTDQVPTSNIQRLSSKIPWTRRFVHLEHCLNAKVLFRCKKGSAAGTWEQLWLMAVKPRKYWNNLCEGLILESKLVLKYNNWKDDRCSVFLVMALQRDPWRLIDSGPRGYSCLLSPLITKLLPISAPPGLSSCNWVWASHLSSGPGCYLLLSSRTRGPMCEVRRLFVTEKERTDHGTGLTSLLYTSDTRLLPSAPAQLTRIEGWALFSKSRAW